MSAGGAFLLFIVGMVGLAGIVALAYIEHRAYVRMFDHRGYRRRFHPLCWLGFHKDKLVAAHKGFDLLRCTRCDQPSMKRDRHYERMPK